MHKVSKYPRKLVLSNRCWACDKGGRVSNYRLVGDDKTSVRPVHFNEKCIAAAKSKYKTFLSARKTVSSKA